MDGLDSITSRRDFEGEVKHMEHGQPIEAFQLWMKEAEEAGVVDPHSMVLSTIGPEGPNSRIVYLREIEGEDFIFYTNYDSEKAHDIEKDNRVSALFYWQALDVQVRLNGVVEKVEKEKSDSYFDQRPRNSQIGAWASKQSHHLSSREELEAEFEKKKLEFEGQDVKCPPFWGGYRVKPSKVEFWIGRPSRLHDRVVFNKAENGSWQMSRLYP